MGGGLYDWHSGWDEDMDAAYAQGKGACRTTLTAVLTAARDGVKNADYLQALDEIAEAMDLKRKEEVKYVA